MKNLVTRLVRSAFVRSSQPTPGTVSTVRRQRRRLDVETLEERLAPAVFNVNSLADILNPPAGVVTLRSAISSANATPGSNTINLTLPGTYKITLAGTYEDHNATGDFDILPNPQSPAGSTLTIQNTSGGAVTVSGNQLDRVFDINPSAGPVPANYTVLFGGPQASQGFKITGGLTPVDDFNLGGGGGIEDQGNVNLTLNNMVVVGNQANDDGGGICMWDDNDASWTLTLSHCTISTNSVNDAGGGIFSNGTGNIVINNGTVISGNFAYNQGGGVWLDSIGWDSANLTMDNTLVSNNQAFSVTGLGGGVANDGNGVVTITNSTFQNNTAGTTGGGFGDRNGRGTLNIRNSLFTGNSATSDGGAIAAAGPLTTLTNTEIDSNTSGGNGGGLSIGGAQVIAQSCTLANNSATGNGGALELNTTSGAGTSPGSSMTDCTLTGNKATGTAAKGGSIDTGAGFAGSMKLVNDTINANSATTGGGIFWTAHAPTSFGLENTIVAGNSATTAPDLSAPSPFYDFGGNLIGVSGAGSGNTGFTQATTQVGSLAQPLNPLLGALGNNGGPTVGATGTTKSLQTEAPLTGSPAVGKGVLSGAPATDELGMASVTNGKINVGPVSLVPPAAAATITGQTIQVTEGQAFNGQLATMQYAGAPANATFTATIDWGDSTTPSTGTVTGSNGSYTISGSHTYADEGAYTLLIKVANTATPTVLIATGTAKANVAEGDKLSGQVTASLSAFVASAFSGTVATVTDSYTRSPATDFTATIAWGDNTSSAGTVSGANGSFTVAGTHTYSSAGSYSLTVTLTEKAPGSATVTVLGSITVSNEAPRPAIQDVLNALPAMKSAAVTSSDTNKLADVIDKLTPALASSLWIDDSHLQPTTGSAVFDSVNNAVTELFGMYQDSTSLVPKSQLLALLNKLAQATEQLAAVAIAAAKARNGNATELALANQELTNGMNDLQAGNFNTVIGHFKNAWLDALAS